MRQFFLKDAYCKWNKIPSDWRKLFQIQNLEILKYGNLWISNGKIDSMHFCFKNFWEKKFYSGSLILFFKLKGKVGWMQKKIINN